VRLLLDLGYTDVRHYRGGLADWMTAKLPIETGVSVGGPPAATAALAAPVASSRRLRVGRLQSSWLLDLVDRATTSRLFSIWVLMVLGCGVLYWLAALAGRGDSFGLQAGGAPIGLDLAGLLTAVYFSFVTATSVGYGDVAPLGFVRALAIAEAVAGLLIFGAVVAKLVSRRQDELVHEIHRITFEERLDRVQSSLHLVLADLQAIGAACDAGTLRPERIALRLESAAHLFAGELRSTRDLLYRPQSAPDEPVLAAILASLEAALRELADLVACLPSRIERSANLDVAMREVTRLAVDICGECVPHDYAPELKGWMDRIQATARRIA
jgi:Ion channel